MQEISERGPAQAKCEAEPRRWLLPKHDVLNAMYRMKFAEWAGRLLIGQQRDARASIEFEREWQHAEHAGSHPDAHAAVA
jgi:hypothetical protein